MIWLWVFFASVLEEIIVPLPSTAIVAAAALLQDPAGIFLQVVLPSALGSTIGSLFLYSIGSISAEAVERIWNIGIREYAAKLRNPLGLFILRAIPVVPFSAVSAAAGAVGLPLPGYLSASFLGALARNSLIAFPVSVGLKIGMLAGLPWQIAVPAVLFSGAAAYLIWKKKWKEKGLPFFRVGRGKPS